jgi:hypothetical protein
MNLECRKSCQKSKLSLYRLRIVRLKLAIICSAISTRHGASLWEMSNSSVWLSISCSATSCATHSFESTPSGTAIFWMIWPLVHRGNNRRHIRMVYIPPKIVNCTPPHDWNSLPSCSNL